MTPHTEAADLLIEARWVAPVEPQALLKNHAVVVRQGRIIDLLPISQAKTKYAPTQRVALENHLLIPGLINLHTHAAMSLMRGLADDQPLMAWLQQHIWPAEAAHVSPSFVLDGTSLACAEMLRSGITCFNDMYFYPDAIAKAASAFGMRAVIGITTLEFPTNYASDADDYLNKGLAVREAYLDHPLLRFSLAPHAPYTVSNTSFERILTISEQLRLPIHCHIHETQHEIEESMRQHGMRPLERLHRLGVLGPDFIGVHGVHFTDDELHLLTQTGTHIAHCPISNLKLASGIANVSRMRQLGINVGLGTDGAASNNRLDLLDEMRFAALLAKGRSGDASTLPATEALHMATLGAAKALGLADEIGSISLGKAADICAIDLSGIENTPCFDPLSHLVHVLGRDSVSHVWVAGKCCVDHKKLLFNDTNALERAVALWQNKMEFRPAI